MSASVFSLWALFVLDSSAWGYCVELVRAGGLFFTDLGLNSFLCTLYTFERFSCDLVYSSLPLAC